MNDTIGSCRNKKITGICFFSESKDVDGVIEAKICLETSQEVLKEIARVLSFHKEVVSVKFQNEGDKVCGSSRNEHFYDDFCLHLPPHVTAEDPPSGGINRMISDTTARTLSDEKGERSDYGSQGSPGSPHQFRKLSTLQLNENKFVFMVENTETEEDYVMKESTVSSQAQLDTSKNEYLMIKKLHEGGRKLGIIDTPMLYEENIRNTMVYKMYTCDLFNFLHEYCNINKSRGVSEDVAKVWIAQLLVAVDAMAEKGMAHRDLKPENILLDNLGNIVITDFELAQEFPKRSIRNQEEEVHIVGTPLYIPPEVGSKGFVDVRKYDLWAVGVIAWELVHDTNPWEIDVNCLPPHRILAETNRTFTLDAKDAKPKGMSDDYFDFVSKVVCHHSKRMSLKGAMKHKIFKGLKFSKPRTFFPETEPVPELACISSILSDMRGDREQKNTKDKAWKSPSVSPVPTSRIFGNSPFSYSKARRTLSLPNNTNREARKTKHKIKAELLRFQSWLKVQRLTSSPKRDSQVILNQNLILRQNVLDSSSKAREKFMNENSVRRAKKSGGLDAGKTVLTRQEANDRREKSNIEGSKEKSQSQNPSPTHRLRKLSIAKYTGTGQVGSALID